MSRRPRRSDANPTLVNRLRDGVWAVTAGDLINGADAIEEAAKLLDHVAPDEVRVAAWFERFLPGWPRR